MGVPRLELRAHRREDLHEADTALDEAAGQKTAQAVARGLGIVEAVEPARGLRLASDVEHRPRAELHSGGQLVVADAGFQVRFARIGPAMVLVEAGEQVEAVADARIDAVARHHEVGLTARAVGKMYWRCANDPKMPAKRASR